MPTRGACSGRVARSESGWTAGAKVLQPKTCTSSLVKLHSANLILPQGVKAGDLETCRTTSGNLPFTGKTDLDAGMGMFLCYGTVGTVVAEMKIVLSCERIGLVSISSILLSGCGRRQEGVKRTANKRTSALGSASLNLISRSPTP